MVTECLEHFENGVGDAVIVESEWIKFAYSHINSPVKFSINKGFEV